MLLNITIVSLAVFVFQSVFCYAKAYITVRLSKCDDANLKNQKFFCYLYKQGENLFYSSSHICSIYNNNLCGYFRVSEWVYAPYLC